MPRKQPPLSVSANLSPVIQLGDVTTDPNNARKRTDRNRQSIKASLEKFKAGRSIVLDKNNVVRAGNGTVDVARELGYTEIIVVEPKEGQLVAVRRPEWTAQEAKAYAIADNRSAELAEWDEGVLAEQLEELRSADLLAEAGYDDKELNDLIKSLGDEMIPPETDIQIEDQYAIMIRCGSEAHQQEIYERLSGEGYDCKVVCI